MITLLDIVVTGLIEVSFVLILAIIALYSLHLSLQLCIKIYHTFDRIINKWKVNNAQDSPRCDE